MPHDDKRRFTSIRGENLPAGRAWPNLVAALRRAGFSHTAGGARPCRFPFEARPEISVEGLRALFFAGEGGVVELQQNSPAAIAFVDAIAGAAGLAGDARARAAAAWAAREPPVLCSLQIEFETSPAGLLVRCLDGGGGALAAFDGYALELQFEGAPALRESLHGGSAGFRAGAALLEQHRLARIAIELMPFSTVALVPCGDASR
jgi:hypothetical protein